MTVANKISGEFAQMITCQLDAGQSLYADAAKFRWKTPNVTLETRLSAPGGAADSANQQSKQGGSFLKAALATATEVGKRVLSGQSLAFQYFTPAGGSGLVAVAGDQPGQVRVIELDGTVGWRTESRAFVAAESTISYNIDFSGFNMGRRSHNGYIMEHFTGIGSLMVGGGGTLVDVNPATYGGKIQVHGGAVVAFSDAVTFATEPVGALSAQTIMSAAFGGQGFNLVTFSGDGPVILQTTLYRELENQDREGDAQASGAREAVLGRF
jgi:uncharacterized protein (AIM24 family)